MNLFKNISGKPVPLVERITAYYKKYEKYVPLLSFFAGFGWDNLTLKRIDQLIDNLQLLFYLILLATCIILVNLIQSRAVKKPLLLKYSDWYPLGIQFFLGGLFSAYVVFYFQSASVTESFLFVILLFLLLVANEFLENRLTNLYLQLSLFFIAAFSFFIFFLPVVTKKLNVYMFLLGGFISLVLVGGVLIILRKKNAIASNRQFKRVIGIIGSLYILLNGFYFINWIPPVPLSLKEGAIFHHVKRVDSRYEVQYEKPGWYEFWKNSDEEFHFAPGDTVFCFASVFAPTRLETKIYQHWQFYHPERGEWITTDRLSYPITGGRDGGYRGFTYKKNVQPGEWRVDVEDAQGRLLGRISFKVIEIPRRNYLLITEYR
ncbi:MAG: DUF2914 domain-containing protein [Calditrichaeota bacterium]|nr:MAG: DUF2914 domain-containing protein [Calditrichota bacterium]